MLEEAGLLTALLAGLNAVFAAIVPLALLSIVVLAGAWYGLGKLPRMDALAWAQGPYDAVTRRVKDNWAAVGRLERAERAVDAEGVWFTAPLVPPREYRYNLKQSIPILTVANLKGGVGKTTVSANLAAYFAETVNERVLLIDLDFQGSLSSTVIGTDAFVPKGRSGLSSASLTIAGALSPKALISEAFPAKGVDRLRCIPAYYDLAQMENRLLVHWLTGRVARDIRYTLAHLLLTDPIQEAFDRVIIDAPPRLTTAAVQALCASTHVLVPTILDPMSSDAVGSFLDQVMIHRRRMVWPDLQVVGVVGTLTKEDVGQRLVTDPYAEPFSRIAEREGYLAVEAALAQVTARHDLEHAPIEILPVETFIQERAEISQIAGRAIAYANGSDQLRAQFARLGQAVGEQMLVG